MVTVIAFWRWKCRLQLLNPADEECAEVLEEVTRHHGHGIPGAAARRAPPEAQYPSLPRAISGHLGICCSLPNTKPPGDRRALDQLKSPFLLKRDCRHKSNLQDSRVNLACLCRFWSGFEAFGEKQLLENMYYKQMGEKGKRNIRVMRWASHPHMKRVKLWGALAIFSQVFLRSLNPSLEASFIPAGRRAFHRLLFHFQLEQEGLYGWMEA